MSMASLNNVLTVWAAFRRQLDKTLCSPYTVRIARHSVLGKVVPAGAVIPAIKER